MALECGYTIANMMYNNAIGGLKRQIPKGAKTIHSLIEMYPENIALKEQFGIKFAQLTWIEDNGNGDCVENKIIVKYITE